MSFITAKTINTFTRISLPCTDYNVVEKGKQLCNVSLLLKTLLPPKSPDSTRLVLWQHCGLINPPSLTPLDPLLTPHE